MQKITDLDIIVPIALELDHPTRESIVTDMLEQHNKYGFTRFALAAPGGGWRSVGYPPKTHYAELAELFLQVKNDLLPYDIECGWWNTLTIKSGRTEGFTPIVRDDGEIHPFANCPLDKRFIKRFSEDVASFAQHAKPAFIITEDDYSVRAANGCYCEHHLAEFEKRMGKRYSREQILTMLKQQTPEAIEFIRTWRSISKDALVNLATEVRIALDKQSPEIPMGYMQAASADIDGDCTQAIARAMAGDKHTPFSRLFGAFYGGAQAREIPETMYHPLYTKQHLPQPFGYYHETDSFPHTRFFTAGKHILAMLASACSYGFDGSTLQTQQLVDVANEESAYGMILAKERVRLNAVRRFAKQCTLKGVQIEYDPLYHTLDLAAPKSASVWVNCISRFGIPYTTTPEKIRFWDKAQAQFAEDTAVIQALSGTLFLDGDAAKALYARGYGKYIGVSVGEDIISGTRTAYDLGAREIICDAFCDQGKGKAMPSAFMFAPSGNGKWLKLMVEDATCEVITEAYTFQNERLAPTMTRFKNTLGGNVIIMSLTLDGNHSQALYNYRRQRLLQKLLLQCCDTYVFVREAAEVFLIQNDAENADFAGMLTLINLCEDAHENLALHLPPQWKDKALFMLDADGLPKPLDYTKTDDGIVLNEPLNHLAPLYIIGK